MSDLHVIARAITGVKAGSPAKPPPPQGMTRAVVQSVNADGTVVVHIAGDTTDVQADCLESAIVTDGTVVELLTFGTRPVVMGVLATSPSGGWQTGDYLYSGSTADRPGFLLCDGSAFSGTAHPALETYLGGTTLPDFRGRMPIGVGSVGTNAQPTVALGGTTANGVAGEAEHLMDEAELPLHDHGGNTGNEDSDHTHETPTDSVVENPGSSLSIVPSASAPVGSVGVTASLQVTSGQSGDHAHPIPNDGGGLAHNNMPPMYGVAVFIKT